MAGNGEILEYNLPCNHCGSSNAAARYANGVFCHKCRKTVGRINNQGKPMTTDNNEFRDTTKGAPVDLDFYYSAGYKAITERKIQQETCKKYGVRTDDKGDHLFPGYNEAGDLIAVKTRMLSKELDDGKKVFSIKGPWGDCVLFGANEFPKTGRSLTITEGEYDALAAYQMTGSKYPNVSILNGVSSAKKDFTNNFEAIGAFDSVVINFDSDKPGKEGAEAVAPMFPGKTKVMHLVEAKDACDYLVSYKIAKYVDEFWKAVPYVMGGLVNAADTWEECLKENKVQSIPFPDDWVGLNQKTYGVRKGEIVLITAGTGSGKTQWLRELKHWWLRKTKERILDISLEEKYTQSVMGLVALSANLRITLPDVHMDESEQQKLHQDLFKDRRFLLHDHSGSYYNTNLIDQITNAVVMEKCSIIFLDHITIAVSDAAAGEENLSMDRFMNALLQIVQKYNVTLIIVSHLRKTGGGGKSFEEGRIPCEDDLKGSGSLKQIAMTTIALSRDKYAEDEKIRNTTSFHVLKCRFTGRSGPCDMAYFDDSTGRMVVIDPETFFEDSNEFDDQSIGSM